MKFSDKIISKRKQCLLQTTLMIRNKRRNEIVWKRNNWGKMSEVELKNKWKMRKKEMPKIKIIKYIIFNKIKDNKRIIRNV